MLGHKLIQQWSNKFDVWATVRASLSQYSGISSFDESKLFCNVDVTDIQSVERAVSSVKPDVIINAAGIIKQKRSAKDVEATLKVNSIFPNLLADVAERYNSRLFCISTDCVFDGVDGNYSEEDVPNARDLYGRSKILGEVEKPNCLTLRTSIIGHELGTSHSLIDWFLGNEGQTVRGFVNAVYSGFPTVVFAEILADLILNHENLEGLYHVSSDPINKFELLQLVKTAYKVDIDIEPFEDFKIDRSLNSSKFRREVGFDPSSWDKMIERMAQDSMPYKTWKK